MSTPTTDESLRQQVHQLWTGNFLNVRRATEDARQQGRSRIDCGLELEGVTFDARGEFFPGARECLAFLATNSHFGLHLWTLAATDKVQLIITSKLMPAGITVRGQNSNPLRTNIAWDGRKPWFDVLFDRTSAFDAAAGHWYWAHHLLHAAAKSLANAVSATAIIHSTDRFHVAPVEGLQRPRM